MVKNWKKVLYAVIVALLFLPLVFMGANVFFDEYPDRDYERDKCYQPTPVKLEGEAAEQQRLEQNACLQKYEEERKEYHENKRVYDGWKYVFITVVSLIALLAAIFIPLDVSIVYGLFSGSVLATFFSTWIYFQSRSKIGFGLLVVIFILCVYFIDKQRKK